jgi:NAD(P)-dependent dehydrogenase (short-subunit alcohol dehydrogenase family)
MRLAEKVAVITGGGAGLGRECALLFASEGARVVVADIDAGRAAQVAAEVRESGGEALANECDVTDERSVEAMVEMTLTAFGRLDVMHANAGIPSTGFGTLAFEDTSVEEWHRVMSVNFLGVFLCAKHSVGPMRQNGGGSIVVTSSAAGLAAFPGWAVYAASKAGAIGLVRGLATDLGRYGIRVNALCPMHGMPASFGPEATEDVTGLSWEEVSVREHGSWDPAMIGSPLVLQRPPRVRDNAYAALFLASDESAYLSGVALPSCDAGAGAVTAARLDDNDYFVPDGGEV